MTQGDANSAALMPARLLHAGLAPCPHCQRALPLAQALDYCPHCGAPLAAEGQAPQRADHGEPLARLDPIAQTAPDLELWEAAPPPAGQDDAALRDPLGLEPGPFAPAALQASDSAPRRPRQAYDPAQWQVKTAPAEAPAAVPAGDSPVALTGWALELWLRRLAVPMALLIAVVFHLGAIGRFVQRLVLGMMVHESGHAITAWFAGFWAVPLPWVTRIGEHRSLPWALAMTAALLLLVAIGRRREQGWLVATGAAALLLQGWLTWGLSEARAQALIVWGGDGAGMMLAAALMALFALGQRARLVHGGLRWGFLVIGAGAFVDLAMPWLQAVGDASAIPYGRIEGVGLSDPSRMTDTYGWLQSELIRSYLTCAGVSLGVVAASWWWGLGDAARQRRAGTPLDDG